MVLVIESGRAKVDKPNLRIKQDLAMSGRAIHRRRRRRHRPIVSEGLVVVVDEKDVLRLQIGVDQVQVVQKSHAGEELFRELLDVRAREWYEAIRLEKVKHALSVEIGDDADVVPEIEAIS